MSFAITPDNDVACAIGVVDGKLVLAVRAPDGEPVGLVLSPAEADRLAGRLRKHASDLRAAKARER